MSTPRVARFLSLVSTSAGDGTLLVPSNFASAFGSEATATEIGKTTDAVNPGLIGQLDTPLRTPARLGLVRGTFAVRFVWEITDAADAGTTVRINAALRRIDADGNAEELARIEGVERAADAAVEFTERYAAAIEDLRAPVEAGDELEVRFETEVVSANGGSLTIDLHHDPDEDQAFVFLGFGEIVHTS